MRILLLSPGTGQSLEYQPSLGLAYILAYLKTSGCADTHFADHDLVGMRGMEAPAGRPSILRCASMVLGRLGLAAGDMDDAAAQTGGA
ncbi:MAG: hypothetical protein IMZ44_13115 [Planctomycetes bacterium]|nr:hypothetical protein [Planctomycetota bacterium]